MILPNIRAMKRLITIKAHLIGSKHMFIKDIHRDFVDKRMRNPGAYMRCEMLLERENVGETDRHGPQSLHEVCLP